MSEQTLDIIIGIFFSVIILSAIALYAFCIIDIHKYKVKYHSKRVVWLNFIWFAPIIGCIIYLMNRKNIWRESNSSV